MSVLSFNCRIAELNDLAELNNQSMNAESDLPHFVVSDVYFLLVFNITRCIQASVWLIRALTKQKVSMSINVLIINKEICSCDHLYQLPRKKQTGAFFLCCSRACVCMRVCILFVCVSGPQNC